MHIEKLSLAALTALALAAPASADQFWVKAGASGDGKTKEAPAGELHPILNIARRGDVIHVAQGEYNGRDQKGEFKLEAPYLTLLGGYSDDFSERHPFKHPTVLKRKEGVKANYTEVLNGLLGVDPDAHGDGRRVTCTGLIVDGFFFDSSTRNQYGGPGPGLAQGGSWKEPVIKLLTAEDPLAGNLTIRNCVFVNCYYQGIYAKWFGENEVSNCLFVNCSIAGIDGTGAKPDSKLTIKNCTLAGFYSHDKAQMAHGVICNAGTYVIQDNVFAYLSAPANGVRGEGDKVTVSGNVFWFTNDAEKIARDQNTAASGAGARRDDEEEEEEESGKNTPAGGATGNVNEDPEFKCDKEWFDSLTTFGIVFNKFPAETMNAQRAKLGLDARKAGGGSDGKPELMAFMRPYPTSDWTALVPQWVAKQAGKGVQLDGPFKSDYAERPAPEDMLGAVPGGKDDYQEISWDDLVGQAKKGDLDGKRVKLKVGLGPLQTRWDLKDKGVEGGNYMAFELRKPGNTNENLPEKIMGYAVMGSSVSERFNEHGQKNKRKETWKEGVWIRGIIHQAGQGKTPWSIVVDYMGKP